MSVKSSQLPSYCSQNRVVDTALLYPFPYMGTKIRLLPDIERHFPKKVLTGELTRYVDPFMGGGSVIISMIYKSMVTRTLSFKEFYGFDNNSDLVIVYTTLIKHSEKVLNYLFKMQTIFNSLSSEDREKYYYQVRNTFNDTSRFKGFDTYKIPCDVKSTARLIFLINTSFGRSLSYNKKGDFKTTYNSSDYSKNNRTLNIHFDRISRCSDLLKFAKIGYGDFEISGNLIDKDTFVYLDPPYVKTDSSLPVTAYSQNIFRLSDQYRVRDFMLKHSLESKAYIMTSNTGHSTGGDIVKQVYDGFYFYSISVNRKIGSVAKHLSVKKMTTQLSEYLITSYKVNHPCSLFS